MKQTYEWPRGQKEDAYEKDVLENGLQGGGT